MLRYLLPFFCAVFFVSTLAFGYQFTREIKKIDEADHLDHAAKMLLVALLDAETGQRGFIITGYENFLVPYAAGISVVHERLTDLAKAADDREHGTVVHLTELTEQKLVELEKTIEIRRKDEKAAKEEVKNHLGKNIMDEIRRNIDHIELDSLKIINHSTKMSTWYARLAFIFFLASLATTVPLMSVMRDD